MLITWIGAINSITLLSLNINFWQNIFATVHQIFNTFDDHFLVQYRGISSWLCYTSFLIFIFLMLWTSCCIFDFGTLIFFWCLRWIGECIHRLTLSDKLTQTARTFYGIIALYVLCIWKVMLLNISESLMELSSQGLKYHSQ